MKKWSIYGLCLVLLLTLCACGKKDDNESNTPTGGDGHRLGMAAVSAMDMKGEDSTNVTATVAAVLLDKEGVIRQCRLEEISFDATLKNGVLQDMMDMVGKWELGDDYALTDDERGDSQTTYSWREQVDAFCRHVEGMTPDEVSGIAATDGRSNEIEGCHLVITDFIQAVHKAGKEAKTCSATDSDTLKLAVTADKSKDSSDEAPRFDIEMAAVTVGKDNKLTGCFTDTLQAKMTVEEGLFSMATGDITTKRQMGDAYGMKEASSIKKEWYQQADAFDTYAMGKTTEELRGIKTDGEGKVDGISGCTIQVSGMLKNVIKAVEQTDKNAGGNTTTGTSKDSLGDDISDTVSDTVSDISDDVSDMTN